ncbi:MAG: T9SS C-terminal target domain-containing protein, partial [Ignavibacteriales bacterium]
QVDNTAAISKDGTLYIGVHGVATCSGGLTQTLIAIKDTGTVSVNEISSDIQNFSLSQNYPNPFNPTTTIRYSLPEETNVTIIIYDILGREVSILVDEEKPAGEYEVSWNASVFPSEIYFLRMQAGHFSEAKKLLLIK